MNDLFRINVFSLLIFIHLKKKHLFDHFVSNVGVKVFHNILNDKFVSNFVKLELSYEIEYLTFLSLLIQRYPMKC